MAPEMKPVRYVVDGHEFPNQDSNLAGDGQHAPFRVFDIPAQDYLPGTYPTRAAAQVIADKLNQEGRLTPHGNP